ncbi:9801_t:CDS:1, partial [Gigaspora rosea]
PEVVVLCWKKCLDKAKNYWKAIGNEIGDESKNENEDNLNLYSEDKIFNSEE